MTEIESNSFSKINFLLIILSLVALVFTFLGQADPYTPRSFHAFWDTGHVLAFFLWTFLLLRFYRPLMNTGFQYRLMWCCFLAVIAGSLIEFAQTVFNREASIQDIANDVLGSLLAVACSSGRNDLIKKSHRIILLCLSGLLIVGINRMAFVYLIDEFLARSQFPVLLDFSTPFEETRIRGNAHYVLVKENATRFVKLDLGTELYSGFSLGDFPRDWSEYSMVLLRFNNPGDDELGITCRIHDVQHSDGDEEYGDRFNQSYVLLPGENKLVINLKDVMIAPQVRTLDLANVGGLGCFTVQLSHRRTLFLYEIYLLP